MSLCLAQVEKLWKFGIHLFQEKIPFQQNIDNFPNTNNHNAKS